MEHGVMGLGWIRVVGKGNWKKLEVGKFEVGKSEVGKFLFKRA